MKLLYKYVFIICIFLSFGQSQKIQPEITNKKQRLIILPSEKGDDESSIQYQLVEIVAAEATQLGRYNVFNRQDLKKIFEEQALYMAGVINDSSIIEFGQIAGAKEAMLIKLIQFDQHGIPKPDKKEEETNFFDVIVAIVDASSKKEFNITIPHPLFTSHYTPDILDRISRKSNRLRLKIVTKVNGKDYSFFFLQN